jgi:hypothetical protein
MKIPWHESEGFVVFPVRLQSVPGHALADCDDRHRFYAGR